MGDHARELEAAKEFASAGAKIALAYYREPTGARLKPDGTWVTDADRAVEEEIRSRIARAFPHHNVVGEEEGAAASGGGPPREGAPTWVVDPIDGTHNYMAGIPIWATLVGLREEGRSVVGAVSAPVLGEAYDGALGLGARVNDEAIRVDPLADLSKATVLTGGADAFRKRGLGPLHDDLVARAWRSRGFGDFWGHVLVARGAAHVMVEPELNLWDFAALEPIVSEAGGRMTGISGDALEDGGSCLTTNGALHDEVVALASRYL